MHSLMVNSVKKNQLLSDEEQADANNLILYLALPRLRERKSSQYI